MEDLTMIINKIDELKSDNVIDHKEIKESIKCLPCLDHSIKIAKLEASSGYSDAGKSKLDDVVTKRVMYIFGGIIAGVVLLVKELPNIITAIQSIKQ